jgi:O-antigen ligase
MHMSPVPRVTGRSPRSRQVKPSHRAGAFILLITASEVTLRQARDAQLALQGSIDLQILIQLAVWGAVGAWLAFLSLSGGAGRVTSLTEPGPAVRVLMFVSVVVFTASLYAPSVLATVRAVQFIILTLLVRVCCHQLAGDPERIDEFWGSVRRGMWGFCATVATLSFLSPWTDNFTFSATTGQRRYRWFTMHPISVAVLLSLAIVLLAGAVVRDWRRLLRRGRIVPSAVFGAGLFVLLLWTKSRGAIAATLLAAVILLLLSRDRQLRALSALACGLIAATLLLGVGERQVQNVTLRGQSTDEVLGLTGRTALFGYSWELFLDRPVFGYGYMAGRSVYLDRFPWAGESHNVYLEILVSMGLAGFAAFAFLFARAARLLVLAARDWRQPGSYLGREGLALLAMVLVNGVVGAGFAVQPNSQTVALVWGVVLADLSWSVRSGRRARVLPLQRFPGRDTPAT